jgi:tetratricopeptide (TPR) repeat protein
LVLASAHVTGSIGLEVDVFRPGRAGTTTGKVVWSGIPGGRDDAALVRIDPGFCDIAGWVQWGRLVTDRAGLECETWGTPDAVQDDQAVEARHIQGRLNPGDRFVGNRYTVSVHGHPYSSAHGASPWAGMSGAAVFSGDLLIGVVAVDPVRAQHAELVAVPAYVLWHDKGFRAALGSPARRLAPVELDHGGITPPASIPTPAALLLARHEVVPWWPRPELIGALHDWMDEPGPGVLLLHGSGGRGKTRAAIQLGHEMPAIWSVYWPAPDTPLDKLDSARHLIAPTLVVVDYADSRPDQLRALLAAACAATQMKLLLLARTSGPWWTELPLVGDPVADLLDNAVVRQVELLDTSPEPAGACDVVPSAYDVAVTAFASRLSEIAGLDEYPWQAIADTLRGRTPLLAHALTLHMTALADLLDSAIVLESNPGGGRSAAEDRVLIHERRYWTAVARAQGLPLALDSVLDDAVAAVILAGPSAAADIARVLQAIPELADQPQLTVAALIRWLASLYPPSSPATSLDTLRPDRLAERHAAHRATFNPGLTHHLAPAMSREQATTMLTVLTRAASHPAATGLDDHITALCQAIPDALAAAAITVATHSERPAPLLDALAAVITDPTASTDLLMNLVSALPYSSLRLVDVADQLSSTLVERHRELADVDPRIHLQDLVVSLHNRSVRLGMLGRHEQALAVVEEAVSIQRVLVQKHRDIYQPDLATSLNTLANALGKLGRHEQALAVVEEAVSIQRVLVQKHRDIYQPDLATSLNTLANALGKLGRHEQALAVVEEAVSIQRVLVQKHRDIYQPDLATSLSTLAKSLSDLGWHEEALAACLDATDMYYALDETHPDAFRPELAKSVDSLSVHLGRLGDHKGALGTAEIAVRFYRQLVASRPDVFVPGLAVSLHNQAIWLGTLGQRAQALAAVDEAIQLRTQLANDLPAVYLPDLEQSQVAQRLIMRGSTPEPI